MRYEKLNTKGGGARDGDGEHKDENYRQTMKRRRDSIRRLACMNFSRYDKFITLTFRDTEEYDIKNVKECNQQLDKFLKRLRRRYPDLKYIWVTEFQDKNGRGAVHYHLLCNMPYVNQDELTTIWSNGYVYINAIDHVDNVGAYLIKYMNKDMNDDRLQGLRAYNCSRGLQRPTEYKSWDSISENLSDYKRIKMTTEKLTPSYSAKYESEQAGEMEYIQYNLQRQNSTN